MLRSQITQLSAAHTFANRLSALALFEMISERRTPLSSAPTTVAISISHYNDPTRNTNPTPAPGNGS
jgi:hypothetical protein